MQPLSGDLERELRDTLADDRLSLPARPDAVALLRSGVRRRRRTRALAAGSAVVVLVAGGMTAASFAAGHEHGSTERVVPPVGGGSPTPAGKPTLPSPTADVVPWAAIAYDYRRPPAFPGAVADASVPWCRASQLSLSQFFQGATGSWAGVVTVTNGSSSTCALQGQPTVSMTAADGRVLVTSRPEPFYVDAWVPLAPGKASGAQVVWWPEFCDLPPPARVVVDLPHGGGRLSTAMRGAARCDASTGVPSSGRLDVDGFVRSQESPFTPLAGLQAGLGRVPRSAAPGTTLGYRLQLQSMDAAGVPLEPCLPFRERLVDHATQQVLIEEDHLLNCDGAPAVIDGSPFHATFFDLQITLPPTAPAGDYDLLWQSVLKPVAAVAEELVHVTPPVAPCRDGQLTAAAGRAGAATGHYGLDIVLHNVSATTCAVRGYPGVQLLDRAGRAMTPAPRRGSAFVFTDPGPTTVVLPARTGVASFAIGGDDYDNVHQRECPSATRIGVFAPQTRTQLIVPAGFPLCPGGVTYSAVVAGADGPQG